MSKANFASTMTYVEGKGKSKFPPKTEIIVSGIDRASLKEKTKDPAGVLTIPAADGGRPLEPERDGEEKE